MDKLEPATYRGKCPVCSGQLKETKEGDGLYCDDHPDHYRVLKMIFEAAWDKWEASKRTIANTEDLMALLLDSSTAPNRPIVKALVVPNDQSISG